jgi:hypothetical protein
MNDSVQLLTRIRILLAFVIVGILISGLTAFALQTELELAARWLGASGSATPEQFSGFTHWIVKIRNALQETNAKYPFVAYGTDWLAFAHLILAILFVGPLIDPVRNIWVTTFGMICCWLVFPLAFICGRIRGIPLEWTLIDCAFGVIAFFPLWRVRRDTLRLQEIQRSARP